MTMCRRTSHRRRIAGGRQRSRSTEQCRKVKTFYCGAAVSVVQFSSFLNFQDDETKSLCLKLCSSRGCCLSSVVWPQLTQRHILSYLNVYLSSLHTGQHILDTSQLILSFYRVCNLWCLWCDDWGWILVLADHQPLLITNNRHHRLRSHVTALK